MNRVAALCARFRGGLIVSCQAPDGTAFRDPQSMARFASAAVQGGAVGIRANGADDIRAIKQQATVPIIGIDKQVHHDGKILITSSFEGARGVVNAGADIVALDCTSRGRREGAFERLARIKSELGVPVMADIATVEEAVTAVDAGADLVASTMRGYTQETENIRAFEPSFIAALAGAVSTPVLAEGRIATPAEAKAAIRAGALAVIVGTAITRPDEITRRFAEAIASMREQRAPRYVLAIDLGGTNTKFGVVSSEGKLIAQSVAATPAGGRDALLDHLKQVARSCIAMAAQSGVSPFALGLATAGWVDPYSGKVVYATENLPGWTGTPVGTELSAEVGLPVVIENDANALAVAEKCFGLARDSDQFASVTLGTGIGGGCYIGGRLNRGANFFANALGHLTIEPNGDPCTCGRKGCLEAYANAAALLRYADHRFRSAEALIEAANGGDAAARKAIQIYAGYLARGCSLLVQMIDPQQIILSGGIAQNNPLLVEALERELAAETPVWKLRHLQIGVSNLGYHGGVLGAAAVALSHLEEQAE